MAYSSSMSRRNADNGYKPRQAWDSTYYVRRLHQFSSETSGATAEPENNSSGGRAVGHETKEYQNMDIDDTDSKDTTMFRKTMELITKMEDLKQLLEQSKDEIKAADKLKQKQNRDTESQRATITGIEHQRDENRKLENESSKLKEENAKLRNQLKKNETDLQEILQGIKKNSNDQVGKVRSENKVLSEEIQKINIENVRYKEEVEKLKHYHGQELDKRNELELSIKHHKTDMDTMAKGYEKVKLQLSQSQNKYKTVEDEKKKLEQELEESKTRLSRLMGNKLADNNPDIADLSDKNRPTKLAEKYAELYDNEWTDAFELFDDFFKNEQESIQNLLLVLESIKEHCDKMAQDQAATLKTAVIMGKNTDGHIPEYVQKQLKDLRRSTAEVSFPEVYQSYIVKLNNSKGGTLVQLMLDGRVQPFIKGCVELCWLMTVQDPPLVFGPKPEAGDVFDTSVYKHYTKTGACIEFLVWPTLHLHEGGAMLGKGVAQGYGRVYSAPDRSSSRERRRNNTAAESAETRPHKAQPVQNIDRDDKGKIYQPPVRASPVSKHLQSQKDQNYQQHVVTGKTRSSNSQFSRTVRDATGNQTDSHLRSNMSSSVRQETNFDRSHVPAYPGKEAMARFYQLNYRVGAESQEIKDQLGDQYFDCLNYYHYFHKKN